MDLEVILAETSDKPSLFKESITFQSLSVDDGLSQVSVNHILQDDKGFMWFATQDGLDRYDGSRFRYFHSTSPRPFKVAGDWIAFVFSDQHKNLWVGTSDRGILKRTLNHQEFEPVPVYDGKKILRSVRCNTIYEDSRGNVWLGTASDGLFLFDPLTQSFKKVSFPEISDYKILTINELNQSLLVGTSGAGVWEISLNYFYQHLKNKENINNFISNNKNMKRNHWMNNHRILKSSVVNHLVVRNNKLWIATESNGIWFNDDSGTLKHLEVPVKYSWLNRSRVSRLLFDTNGNLWIGTKDNGLLIYNSQLKQWLHLKAGEKSGALKNSRITALYQDHTGIIWVGTEGGGVYYYDSLSPQFFNVNIGGSAKLKNKMIYAISQGMHDDWWFGTESGGIARWKNNNQQFQYYTVENQALKHNTVRAFLADKQGMWVATFDGFLHINTFTDEVEVFDKIRLPGLTSQEILTLAWQNNKIWVGSFGGLDLFDPVEKKIIKSLRYQDKNGEEVSIVVTSVLPEKNGIWVATWGRGLLFYDFELKRWKSYQHEYHNPLSLAKNKIWSVLRDSSGMLWIATDGGGLSRFNQATGLFETLNRKKGLSNNVVYSVVESSTGSIWVSTNRGLSKINPQTLEINNYSIDDGLQSREFNAGAFYKNKEMILFGGIDGVSWFKDQNFKANNMSPETEITDVLLFNKALPFDSEKAEMVRRDKLLQLAHNENMISFNLAALHFSNAQQNQLYYRLSGLNDNWQKTKKNRTEISYNGLAPGEYLFEVYAVNPYGVRDSSPAQLQILIKPPFWKSTLAFVIYFFLLISVVFYFIARQKKQLSYEQAVNRALRENSELKESLAATEHYSILGELTSNVAHSVRNPLAVIRTSAELVESSDVISAQNRQDIQTIFNEVDRISRWISDLLSFTRRIEKDENTVNMTQLINRLLEDMKHRIHQHKIKLVRDISDVNTTISGDESLLEHMLVSVISNAIDAMSPNGVLKIKLKLISESKVQIVISDNGCGIPLDEQERIFEPFYTTKAEGVGLGLSLVRKIVERHHGEITIESKPGKGTVFTFQFNIIDGMK